MERFIDVGSRDEYAHLDDSSIVALRCAFGCKTVEQHLAHHSGEGRAQLMRFARLERYLEARHQSRIIRGRAYLRMATNAAYSSSQDTVNEYYAAVVRFQPKSREAILDRIGRNWFQNA